MDNKHTMIKVSKETRDLLKKVAPQMGITMQDAAALAIERLTEDNAAWILRNNPEKRCNR